MIQKYGVTIHAFDPTPRSIQWVKAQTLPHEFVLHEYGISNFDGHIDFYPPVDPSHISHTYIKREKTGGSPIRVPVRKLTTIMSKLGHEKIDLLKLDIEGAEYDVIDDIISSRIQVGQVLIEFHHRFKEIGLDKTRDAIHKLNNHGYKLFDISDTLTEYSFIKSE